MDYQPQHRRPRFSDCEPESMSIPGAISAEPRPASQGPTGISLPTNTGGPDGWPVGEPPGGSTVTA